MNALSDAEIASLIQALARTRGEEGFTEGEAQELIKWANQARVDATLLGLTLSGRIMVDVTTNGVVFKNLAGGGGD